MASAIEKAIAFTNNNKNLMVDRLKEFLRFESISTDSRYASEMYACADWLVNFINNFNSSDAYSLEKIKYPVVYGNISHPGADKPTILVYGHYDVQPADPIDLWKNDPFEPTIKDGSLFARGVSDMKGQLMVVLSAITAIQQSGDLPVNVKFIIEGEEEIGSPNLRSFLEKNKELFLSDFVLNLDAGMISKEKPTIVYGLRGLAYFELEIFGPAQDLHSGMFGGVVYNPIQALAEVIAGLKNVQGRIQIPGFYDDVLPLDGQEKKELQKLGMDEQFYLSQTGTKRLICEEGYSPVECVGARPTLDVNGIYGGYIGEGPKTVIPAKASAKISMRLVPNQTPEKVHQQLHQYLQERMPDHVSWSLKKLASDPASISNIDSLGTRCFANSIEKVWGVSPVFQRGGGSIPIVSHMQEILNIESVLSGFSLPEDNIHSPNEKMDIDLFFKGVETVIHYFFDLSTSCNGYKNHA